MSDFMEDFYKKMREEMPIKTLDDLVPYVATASDWLNQGNNEAKEMMLFTLVIQLDMILRHLDVMKKVRISQANVSENVARDMAQNWADFLRDSRR